MNLALPLVLIPKSHPDASSVVEEKESAYFHSSFLTEPQSSPFFSPSPFFSLEPLRGTLCLQTSYSFSHVFPRKESFNLGRRPWSTYDLIQCPTSLRSNPRMPPKDVALELLKREQEKQLQLQADQHAGSLLLFPTIPLFWIVFRHHSYGVGVISS